MSRKFPQRKPPAKPRAGLTMELGEGRVLNIYCAPAVYQAFGECFTQTISFCPYNNPMKYVVLSPITNQEANTQKVN